MVCIFLFSNRDRRYPDHVSHVSVFYHTIAKKLPVLTYKRSSFLSRQSPTAQMAMTSDDKARPGPLTLGSLAAPGAPGAKDPRPARFRTTARDPRRTTRPRSIKPVIAKALPPADQVWWTATTGRRRGGSISRAGSGCGPMLESLSPADWHQAPSTPEPERLRRLPGSEHR